MLPWARLLLLYLFCNGDDGVKDVLDDKLQGFIKDILPAPDELLAEMMVYAEENHISIVEPEVGNLLNLLVHLLKPRNILEVGTAIGASAIYMARALEDCVPEGVVQTIELVPQRAAQAEANFKAAQLDKRIQVVTGDAREILPNLEAVYDLIFLDAAKGQYDDFLAAASRILRPGGLIVADNVLINGWVVSLDYPHRRKKTMVYRMKALLESFKERTDFQCSLIPLGDGVALLWKKENGDAV